MFHRSCYFAGPSGGRTYLQVERPQERKNTPVVRVFEDSMLQIDIFLDAGLC